MNDAYSEIMVKKPMSFGSKFLKGLLPVMTIVCVFGGMIIWPLLIGAVAFGLATFFLAPKLDVEYEYLYVNGELDIDAIYSKQKRKRIGSYDVEELEILAPAKSHALDSYLKNGVKIKDYTSGDEHAKSFIAVYNKDKEKAVIKVELDEIILKDMRRIAPRKVNLM